ncbi:hypothetical protein OESDEN_10356 [Oesophagostomum dentatum]|uniref:Uncharacterized protein n=1 Tax=Oesophagostomum dentatum TaxID=61180 RepID=A0A0B1T1Y7_OESDE|nr:hypothetical protein OESDEN_10356 [Oesophagostomum dentatum]
MNRTYYEKPNRPVFPPAVFEDPYLELVQHVFDHVVEKGDFDVLHSTRHFGTMVFYLALNGNIPPLLNFFGARGRLHDCANLVRLQKTLHPDWRFAINTGDSDLKIVTDFVKQNVRYRDQLKDLNAFLKDGTVIPSTSQGVTEEQKADSKEKVTVDATNIRGKSGPLGELSDQYEVKVMKSEGAGEAASGEHISRKERRGRFRSQHRSAKDTSKKD